MCDEVDYDCVDGDCVDSDCFCFICECCCEIMECWLDAKPATAAAPITTQYHYVPQRNDECVNETFVSKRLQPVKMIAFMHGYIGEKEVFLNPKIVENTKIIDLLDAEFEGEFYETVLKYCNTMKNLSVRYYCETMSDMALKECLKVGVKNQWQCQNYPTLEHLCWDAYKLPEYLEVLFQQNPNIRSFHAGSHIFGETLELFLQTGIKTDELFLELKNMSDTKLLQEYIPKLNAIHDRQQFRNLMMRLPSLSALKNPRLARLNYLNGLCCDVLDKDVIKINGMPNLKLLIIINRKTTITAQMAETLSKQLDNLDEIYLRIESIDQIAPFICNSPKLRKIVVYNVDEVMKSVDIALLNKKRMKLENACKIVVYLPDFDYSEVKWENKQSTFSVEKKWNEKETKFSLIDIKLGTSDILDHPFVVNMLRSYIITKTQT